MKGTPRIKEGKAMDKSKFSEKFKMDDVEGVIQLMKNEVLAAVLKGEIDLNEVARLEMASRGLDKKGTWVGFQKAAEIHGVRN